MANGFKATHRSLVPPFAQCSLPTRVATMKHGPLIPAALAGWALSAPVESPARSDQILIPPAAVGVEGDSSLGRPLISFGITTQYVYAGSLLSGLRVGDQITGLQFRQEG